MYHPTRNPRKGDVVAGKNNNNNNANTGQSKKGKNNVSSKNKSYASATANRAGSSDPVQNAQQIEMLNQKMDQLFLLLGANTSNLSNGSKSLHGSTAPNV